MIPKRANYEGQSYKLFSDYNEIHVFVEDEGFENLYKCMLKRFGFRIENIFSKNGKESILDSSRKCVDPKCVYIIDRDWEDLLPAVASSANANNLVKLKRHSIENYLIDYESFIGVLIAEHPKRDLYSELTELDYNLHVKFVSSALRPLFECFAAMQMQDAREKGCSHRPGHFQQKNSSCAPDVNLISKFISGKALTISANIREYFEEEDLTEKGHGKFMLHYVWEQLRNLIKCGKISIDKLMIRLAQQVDTSDVRNLANEIRRKIPVQ